MSIRVDKVQLQFEIDTKNKDSQSLHKLNEDIRSAYKSIQQLEKKHKELLSQPPKNKVSQEYKDWKAQISLVGKALQSEQNHLADLDHKKSQLINTMGKEKMTIHELQNELKQYNILLNNLTPGTESFNKVQAYVKDLKKQLADYRQEINSTQSSLTKFVEGFNKFAWAIQFAYQGFQKVVQWADQYVQSFAQMDEAMTDVTKYTGQTKREVEEMNETFKRMETRTAREELNALAGAAGRLGITARKDIEGFVSAADKINVALGDDLGEGAIDQIGKLTMVFGEDKTKGLNGAMLATGSGAKMFRISFSETTGIRALTTVEPSDADAVYNLKGVRMQSEKNLPAGIYVKNGRKFVVK